MLWVIINIELFLFTKMDHKIFFQAQLDARRRIETENTAPLVTDTQINPTRATVDKNCNATAVDQVQGKSHH